MPHILIIEARFYEEITDELKRGAIAALENAEVSYEVVPVPGVLEVPVAVAFAMAPAVPEKSLRLRRYDGVVALGCVIRGETSHYDIVAGESARALMDFSVQHCLALGNGILTVENMEQARVRADVAGKNKGGFAAEACLKMVALKAQLG